MTDTRHRMRLLPYIIMGTLATGILAGCEEEKRPTIGNITDPEHFPTMHTVNVNTWITDSGYMRYHITTPVWLTYDNAEEPHWSFPDTVFLRRFDNGFRQDATFRCDSAYYLSGRKIWRFDGNVRIVNVRGDIILTEQMFWDQNERKVYSDSFIHIETPERVLEGYGFVSNDRLTTYTVRRPSGIFPVGDFGRRGGARDTRNNNDTINNNV